MVPNDKEPRQLSTVGFISHLALFRGHHLSPLRDAIPSAEACHNGCHIDHDSNWKLATMQQCLKEG